MDRVNKRSSRKEIIDILKDTIRYIFVGFILTNLFAVSPCNFVLTSCAPCIWIDDEFQWNNQQQNVSFTDGRIKLDMERKVIVDNFTDNTHLSEMSNLSLDASSGNVKLEKLWNTIGGPNWDESYSINQTVDGGFILTGRTKSYGKGNFDVWLIKADGNGSEIWNRTYGGPSDDYALGVIQATDNGYVIIGSTASYGNGNNDVWLIKVDPDGNEIWNRTYGGGDTDNGRAIEETLDGGFILTGGTYSYSNGENDVWIIKTDSEGNEVWNRTYGGNSFDWGESVIKTSNGGYLIAGDTLSYGMGQYDIWLIKINEEGVEQWNKTYGGNIWDQVYTIQQTDDDGFIFIGYTSSYGAGQYDIWLIKTDSNGNILWARTYGGRDVDIGYSVQQTNDGKYILVGFTRSYGVGSYDLWLIKTDENGIREWNQTYGGRDWDEGWSVKELPNGGYVTCGCTRSYGAGNYDVWLFKTNAVGDLDFTNGEIISTDFLGTVDSYYIESFSYVARVPSGTSLKGHFSIDNITWYNSFGVENGWNTMMDNGGFIDLWGLGWQENHFYYKP